MFLRVFCAVGLLGMASGQPLGLRLPTENQAIFSQDPSRFYQYTHRNFEGRSWNEWRGGQYGFSRNAKRAADGSIVYARFHEGLDIKPVARDASGAPQDVVRAIASGQVVHTNTVSGRSNYGLYVVLEHDWGQGPFYSLYAHLRTITVKRGQRVPAGKGLGLMGWTGRGLDRTRAHVHLELNLRYSDDFQKWHDEYASGTNYHGNYNGLNLSGLDLAKLYLEHRREADLDLVRFIRREMEPYYRVAVPKNGKLSLLARYPWLGEGQSARFGSHSSWEISFTGAGFPVKIEPSQRKVSQPTLTWVEYSAHPHSWNTVGRLSGSGHQVGLTEGGLRHLALVTGDF
ncbi:MAG: M23 family metallopeptidase [Verrucomicrobiota bacterium]